MGASKKQNKKSTPKLLSASWLRSPRAVLGFAGIVAITGATILLFARAITATTTIVPIADTYVSSNYLISHGSANSMKISSSASDSVRDAYLKFQISGVANAANATKITSAKLRLYVVAGSGTGAQLFKSANTTWSETMVYGQQPGVSGTSFANPTVKAGAWVEVILPASMVTTDGLYSFTIKSTVASGIEFATRESANKPQLVLSTASTAATTSTQPSTSTDRAGYTLLWNDEFNGASLDSTKWNYYVGTLDYDQACYQKNAVSVGGGVLTIRSTYQPGVCGNSTSKWTGTATARPYVSGYVRTDATGSSPSRYLVRPDSVASKIVRIEYRAQMPKNATGLWPGLWSRNTQGSTYYGELDLLERFGDPRNSFSYDITTHVGAGRHTGGDSGSVSNWTCPSSALRMNCTFNVEASMNVYAVEIDLPKSEVRYYLNDQLIARHNPSSSPGFSKATWDRAMNDAWDLRLMSQIVAPQDPYHPEPNNSFVTSDLKVDYARVYAKN